MISLKRTVVIASVLIAAVYTPIASSTVVFVADIGDGPTQTGFSAFPLGFGRSGTGPITHSFGSTMLTIDATVDHQLEHRDRGVLGALGTFTQSDLLRDFAVSKDGNSQRALTATISGLSAGSFYEVSIWSYDPFASTSFLTSWTANGSTVKSGYSQNHGAPLSNSDYQFNFIVAANGAGNVDISGIPQDASDGVRINGIQLATAPAPVPEPSIVALLLVGVLGLAVTRWPAARR